MPGDDAVAQELPLVEPERGRAMDRETVELDERSLVDERLDALARRALPARALPLVRGFARRRERFGAHALEPRVRVLARGFRSRHHRAVLHRHGGPRRLSAAASMARDAATAPPRASSGSRSGSATSARSRAA